MGARKRTAITVLACVLVASACSTAQSTAPSALDPGQSINGAETTTSASVVASKEKSSPNTAEEPTSLAELGGIGGATYADLSSAEIASISDVGVVVEVLDVKKTRLNTKHGEFPSAAEILDRGEDGLLSLEPITDIEVRVLEIVGTRTGDFEFTQDQIITINVGGGAFQTVLNQDQIDVLGMTTVVNGPFEPHNEGDDSPPDTEQEEPARAPYPLTWGSSTDEDLTEGDTVLLFLIQHEIDGFDLIETLPMLSPVHPAGIFHSDGKGGWADSTTGKAVDVSALASLVGTKDVAELADLG